MAIVNDNGNGMYMPVAPAYGGGGGFGNGFGGDGWWIILLLLCGWGGMGMGGFGGGLGIDFPWILNGQNNINANTSNGFRDAMLNDGITSIGDKVCNGFNALQGQLYNGQLADLERSFAAQTANSQGLNALQSALAQCCCDNRMATADLKYTVAQENCLDRQAVSDGVRDILANQTAGIQRILDKLCDQELQAERRDNANLRSELQYARTQASQTAQTAQIREGQLAATSALVNELRSCPIPSQPVFGNTPIFQCNGGYNGCGCGAA